MGQPRYYRPTVPAAAWGVLAALVLVGALGAAHVLTVRQARADERRAVLADAAVLERELLASAARIAAERDSLRAVAARIDTVLAWRLRVVHDTAWLPADTAPAVRLVACRAQLDTIASACGAFRAAAADAARAADTQHAHDAATIAAQARQVAALRRADSIAADRSRTARGRRALERAAWAGALVAVFLTGR